MTARLLPVLLHDALGFVPWWYTVTVPAAFDWFIASVRRDVARLGVRVWLQNLFVPMYGQYDWQSRLISFVVRLVQLIARSVGLLFWMVVGLLMVVLIIALPFVPVAGLLGYVAF